MISRVVPAFAIALLLAGCGGSSDESASVVADLVVVDQGPTEVNAGDTVTFVASVANEGPAEATDVTITHHLDSTLTVASIECAATGGAVCPGTLGESMTVASMPAGSGLIFHIVVPGDPNVPGAVTSSLTAHAAADTRHDNDTAEATTIALDLRNGDYSVFASNGRQYTLTLNFNELSYEMSGAQVNQSGSFSRDADGVSYIFNSTGTARFRTSTDLIVGGFDFNLVGSDHIYDHGVRPFVAARRFVTREADLLGETYNQIGLNLRRNDSIESQILPTTFGAGVMHVCTAPAPVQVEHCPAKRLADYALSVNAGVFSGRDDAHNDTIQFRVALSGTHRILLRAQDAFDDSGRHFRVGVPESDGLAGGTFSASSTRTAWGSTTLTDTHYHFSGTVTGGATLAEIAELTPFAAGAPTGLRHGPRSGGDDAQIVFAQGEPLYLMLGETGGPAQGQMDIGLH